MSQIARAVLLLEFVAFVLPISPLQVITPAKIVQYQDVFSATPQTFVRNTNPQQQ